MGNININDKVNYFFNNNKSIIGKTIPLTSVKCGLHESRGRNDKMSTAM